MQRCHAGAIGKVDIRASGNLSNRKVDVAIVSSVVEFRSPRAIYVIRHRSIFAFGMPPKPQQNRINLPR